MEIQSEDHIALGLLAMDISEKEGQQVALLLAFTNPDALAMFNIFCVLPRGS